jgi:hypothetical protein
LISFGVDLFRYQGINILLSLFKVKILLSMWAQQNFPERKWKLLIDDQFQLILFTPREIKTSLTFNSEFPSSRHLKFVWNELNFCFFYVNSSLFYIWVLIKVKKTLVFHNRFFMAGFQIFLRVFCRILKVIWGFYEDILSLIRVFCIRAVIF